MPLERYSRPASILKTLMPNSVPHQINYSLSVSVVSVALGLTEPLPIPAPNLRNQKLDGETSINWD